MKEREPEQFKTYSLKIYDKYATEPGCKQKHKKHIIEHRILGDLKWKLSSQGRKFYLLGKLDWLTFGMLKFLDNCAVCKKCGLL